MFEADCFPSRENEAADGSQSREWWRVETAHAPRFAAAHALLNGFPIF